MEKYCVNCIFMKSWEEFAMDATKPDKRADKCRECERAYRRELERHAKAKKARQQQAERITEVPKANNGEIIVSFD